MTIPLEEIMQDHSTVDVRIVEDVATEKIATPPFGEGNTYVFAGTASDVPILILQQTKKRNQALIIGYGTGATIWLGAYGKVGNQAGFKLVTGSGTSPVLKLESGSEVWAMSDKATSSTLAVWDEQYR